MMLTRHQEVGHLRNGDGKTTLHLIAMNAGFYAVFRTGLQLLRRKSDQKNDPAKALGAMLTGTIAPWRRAQCKCIAPQAWVLSLLCLVLSSRLAPRATANSQRMQPRLL